MSIKKYNWIWFILATIPLAIMIISYANLTEIGNLNLQVVLDRMGFTMEFDDIIELNHHKYVIYFSAPIEGSLEYIIQTFMDNFMPSADNYFIPQYIAYLIRLEIMKVTLNVFLLLPRVINKMINKLGGTEIE